ncbi:CDP-glycerol glycerophosphotransferase family protein [Sporolactobacillus shoreae]|uniref:CDP-glycerol glycerophosphotransferase family protein n=1 Tax=Sporolactobacillus shoreae TaxID=1465501 RepID=UPI001F4F5BDA|nr:CDP-glycerol glycerophosphotransferase family protein [Sporolactobacillus shoreae]
MEKKDKKKVLDLLKFQKNKGVAKQKLMRHDGHYYVTYPYHNLVPESLLIIDNNLQVQRKTRVAEWQGENLNLSGFAYIQKINSAHKWSVKVRFALVNEDTGSKIPIHQSRLKRNIANTVQHGVWARKKYLPFLFVNNYNWSDVSLSIPFNKSEFSNLPYGRYFIEGVIEAGGLTRTFTVGSPVKGKSARPDSLFQSDSIIHLTYGSNWDLHIIKEKIVHSVEKIKVEESALQISGQTDQPDNFRGLLLRKWRGGSYLKFSGSVGQSAFRSDVPLSVFQNDDGYGGWNVFLKSAEETPKPLTFSKENETKLDIGFAEIVVKANSQGHMFFKVRHHGAELLKIDHSGEKIHLRIAGPFKLSNNSYSETRLLFRSADFDRFFFLPVNQSQSQDKYGRSIYDVMINLDGEAGQEFLKHNVFNLYFTIGQESEETFEQYPIYSDDLSLRKIAYDRKDYEFRQDSNQTTQISVSAKWGWIERGKLRRAVLRKLFYPAVRLLPLKRKTIVFESYWGKSFECNPRAIYEYIDKNYPEYETVWGLNNPLTHIKGHAKIVRRHSLKYYYYLARAKYFVNNVNFPVFCRKRKGAVELQTMHGTPLKTLGFDAPGEVKKGKDAADFLAKNSRWDYLCVPSNYVAEVAAGAFKHHAEIVKSGYPRNDKLFFDNRPEKIAEIKKRLGIPLDKKVIFYAPTWRVQNYFKLELDLLRLKKAVGDDSVLLIKFHHFVSSSVHLDQEETGSFIFNESDYDDIRDLYLIADVLITDYSSVMFDFAILNRPILLFTYDLENYRDNLRGMYFDIIKEAPGPICMTNDDLVRELQSIDQFKSKYGDRLTAFRNKFNTYDKGTASEQCVNVLMEKTGR